MRKRRSQCQSGIKFRNDSESSAGNSCSDDTTNAHKSRVTRRSSLSLAAQKQESAKNQVAQDGCGGRGRTKSPLKSLPGSEPHSKKLKLRSSLNEPAQSTDSEQTSTSASSKSRPRTRTRTLGKLDGLSEMTTAETSKQQLSTKELKSEGETPKKLKSSKRSNPLGMTEHELLLALDESGGRLRKRKFAHSYQDDLKKCPISGCNSRGHLLGRFERHFTLAACPIYHNLTPERCRENHEAYERLKKEQEEEAHEMEKSNAPHNTRKQADSGPTPAQMK